LDSILERGERREERYIKGRRNLISKAYKHLERRGGM
jgi:hypothetical protein